MSKETLNNNLDDDELNRFLEELSDPQFIERIRREEERDYQKARIVKFYIQKWVDQKLIKKEDSVGEFLNILDLKEKYFEKNIFSPKDKEKLKEIKIIKMHLNWFIKKYEINLGLSIKKLLKFLEILIKEKGEFLKNELM